MNEINADAVSRKMELAIEGGLMTLGDLKEEF